MEPLQQRTHIQPGYLRREQAAGYLGISLRELDELKHQGNLPFYRLGRKLIVFRPADLDAFMEKFRVAVG